MVHDEASLAVMELPADVARMPPMPQPTQFGERLREMRLAKGLSQSALAEISGLPQASISNLEQGRYDPAWSSAVALADALECTLDEFRKTPKPRKHPGPGRPKKPDPD